MKSQGIGTLSCIRGLLKVEDPFFGRMNPNHLCHNRVKHRSDRYIGYMGETLETLYFMRNSERLGERFGVKSGESDQGSQGSQSGNLNVVHTLCRLYV